MAHTSPLPAEPWKMRKLDPENNIEDRKDFYNQVYLNVLHQLIVNSITLSRYSKVIQGHMDDISFKCPVTESLVVDGP